MKFHFWQYIKNETDIKYLESISNIHKTSSNFTEYREIFPEINKKFFIIGIKSSKGGAFLLINNKYEIIFNVGDTKFTILKNKITTEIKISKGRKISNNKYLFYNIEIKNYIILIKEKNNILDNILFKYNIEDNNFFLLKFTVKKTVKIIGIIKKKK